MVLLCQLIIGPRNRGYLHFWIFLVSKREKRVTKSVFDKHTIKMFRINFFIEIQIYRKKSILATEE